MLRDIEFIGDDYKYYEVKPQQTYDILINDEVLKNERSVTIVSAGEVISYNSYDIK